MFFISNMFCILWCQKSFKNSPRRVRKSTQMRPWDVSEVPWAALSFRIARRNPRGNMVEGSLRHLVDSGCHCNVGATADTSGCWQVGATTF